MGHFEGSSYANIMLKRSTILTNITTITTHAPPPYLGGCEEDLSNERKGLLHRGRMYIQTYITD